MKGPDNVLDNYTLGLLSQQGKKAFALSADRGFKAEYKDFIKLKAKGAELSERNFFGNF